MNALIFDGRRAVLRSDLPRPIPGNCEALLKVRSAGVCSTDLEITKGYMGFSGVMGHEFVADVVAGPQHWLGKRVVAEINFPCTRCPTCKAGNGNHCPNRTVLGIDGHDGVFAEYAVVPIPNLHEVPRGVGDEQAVFTEPLAAAFRIPEQVRLQPVERATVIGDGRLGLLCAMVLALQVPRVRLIGKHPEKLSHAAMRGIETLMVEQQTPTPTEDLVVDASGAPAGFELAMQWVRPRGVLVLKSTFAATGELNLTPLVIHEVQLVGSRCGPFAVALDSLHRGLIDPTDLISGRYSLAQATDALHAAGSPKHIKVLIDP